MPVITMRVPCVVTPRIGSDAYSQPILGKPVRTRCAVLRFDIERKKTTVRTDSSGTRGRAEEEIANVWVLMPKETKIAIDDMLLVQGTQCRVLKVRTRYDVMSKIDHIEVEATIV